MWTCQNCGRIFKHDNQSHFCGTVPKTIDEYIEMQDLDNRKYLEEVRDTIKKTIPDASEKISWSMPTYWKGRNIIHFAANKKHIGLYPGDEAVTFFQEQLRKNGLKFNKGSIQIPYTQSLPLDLISQITLWCYKQYTQVNSK